MKEPKKNKDYYRQDVEYKIFSTGIEIMYITSANLWKAAGEDCESESATAFCVVGDGKRPRMYLNVMELNYCSIVHEMLHAIRFELTESKGFKGLENGLDELLSYICGYTITEILKFCKKKGIEISI
jgi:hypothetical protein